MPRHKTFDKQEVLQDAVELFWKKGFNQTSIQDLVDNLNINRASIYDTYLDKEGLYKQCFFLYRQNIINKIEQIFENENKIKIGFEKFIKYLTSELLLNNNGCLISNSYAELLPSKNNEIRNILDDTRVIWITMIKELLKKAKNNNELKENIDIVNASYFIYSLITGTAVISKTKISQEQIQKSLNLIQITIFK